MLTQELVSNVEPRQRVPNGRYPLCSPEVGATRQRVSEKGSNSCPCVALSSLEPSRVHLGHMLTVLPSLCSDTTHVT